MMLVDLITRLMTEDELSTSRVGVVAAGEAPMRLEIDAAETVVVDPADGAESVCELVVVDAVIETVAVVPAAIARLTRDGILVAVVPSGIAGEAAKVAMESGTEWVALLESDTEERRHLVAAVGVHPAEFGPLVMEHLLYVPGPDRVHVPQSRVDRGRRRILRRTGRTRLLALARQFRDKHGDAVTRVVHGIEALVGDRRVGRNAPGSNPAIFLMPDLPTEPWPDPARWPRIREVVATCERHAAELRTEMRDLVASDSLNSYVQNGYMEDKFQLDDPQGWSSVTLFDNGKPAEGLPCHCTSTRALLAELAPHVSGEVVLLRVAPGTALQPHFDDNDYQQTAHIGIAIPPDCAIRVGSEARVWQEGKAFAFSPTYLHEVWNHSDQPRDIVLIDIWHMDLSEPEIEALTMLRRELTAMREERNAHLTTA